LRQSASQKTKSGIEGIRASFGDITTSKEHFGINEYYFRHRDFQGLRACLWEQIPRGRI
jgi:hypothetical protein